MEGPDHIELDLSRNTFWMHGGKIRVPWRLTMFVLVYILTGIFWGGIALLQPVAINTRYLGHSIMLLAAVSATGILQIMIDGRPFSAVGLARYSHWVTHALAGAVLGIGLVAAAWSAMCTAGIVHMAPGPDSGSALFLMFVENILLFALIAFAEELLMRGYPMLALMERLPAWAAVALTSLVFTASHIWNPHISVIPLINIFLAGVLLGCARVRTGSLWPAIGLHFGWNYAQGAIFGIPVSGLDQHGIVSTVITGPSIWTGGPFGLEGSLPATIVLIAGTALLFVPKKRS
jgi:membrane protease YdiL (CAAX protease family)